MKYPGSLCRSLVHHHHHPRRRRRLGFTSTYRHTHTHQPLLVVYYIFILLILFSQFSPLAISLSQRIIFDFIWCVCLSVYIRCNMFGFLARVLVNVQTCFRVFLFALWLWYSHTLYTIHHTHTHTHLCNARAILCSPKLFRHLFTHHPFIHQYNHHPYISIRYNGVVEWYVDIWYIWIYGYMVCEYTDILYMITFVLFNGIISSRLIDLNKQNC